MGLGDPVPGNICTRQYSPLTCNYDREYILFAGTVGLGVPVPGYIHGNIHPLRGRLSFE